MTQIVTVDPRRLKYIDECHFISEKLHRQMAPGPRAQRVFAVRDEILQGAERLTLTLCTSLKGLGVDYDPENVRSGDHHTCWANITHGGNTAVNFGLTILRLIQSGFLVPGDILVLDNAAVSSTTTQYRYRQLIVCIFI
jgi:hypothetical protein